MQQRHAAADELDYYPTHPWATRALCEWMAGKGLDLSTRTAWDPGCGEGFMARPLGEYYSKVWASDIDDYSATFPEQDFRADFLIPAVWPKPGPPLDVDIIANPPFNIATDFVLTALNATTGVVAIFARSAWLEGGDRFREMFPPGTRDLLKRAGDYPDFAKERAAAPLFDGAGL